MEKVCKCGATLDWSKLPEIGRQTIPQDDDFCDMDCKEGHVAGCDALGYVLVFKNCPTCKSTLTETLT